MVALQKKWLRLLVFQNGKTEINMKRYQIMRTIPYFDSELTVEEYIKKEICKNAGTQSVAFKDNLMVVCNSMGIAYEEKMNYLTYLLKMVAVMSD